MRLATVLTRSTLELDAPQVRVEVHIGEGLPKMTIVGLAETTVKESKERVRAAILNSNFEFPSDKRVTISLAPATLRKEGGGFDLAIAIGLLAACGKIGLRVPGHVEFAGELALTGVLHEIRGALPMTLAAARAGHEVVLPAGSALEGALVERAVVWRAGTLGDVVAHLLGQQSLPRQARVPRPALERRGPDLAQVRGQTGPRRALEIAAAGGHSLLMTGPPGTGKTMLADRLPGILPRLDERDALENAALHSLRGHPPPVERWREPPFRAPHHSASSAALVGGGRIPMPGEVSLAHRGVLFLDELPEFNRTALEVLRQPLQSGTVAITRVAGQVQFPADFQLVCAMNPCPCGYFGDPTHDCHCSLAQIATYRRKISGPLLDRIDLHVTVPRVAVHVLDADVEVEGSDAVRKRVSAARRRQQTRGTINARLPAAVVADVSGCDDAAATLLRRASERFALSARVQHKLLRVARTIADLAGADRVATAHVAEAVALRGDATHSDR
jgi:magnesium chelatase family protein